MVYALYSKHLDRLYIGQTNNIERRLREHLGGVSVYTSRATDWVVIYTEDVATRSDARKRESQLKSERGRHFLRTQT